MPTSVSITSEDRPPSPLKGDNKQGTRVHVYARSLFFIFLAKKLHISKKCSLQAKKRKTPTKQPNYGDGLGIMG